SCDFEEDGVETDCEDDEMFPLKGLDFGLTGGVGVDYAISGVILTPYVRYTQGLTDIPDFEGLDLNIRNNSIQIGLAGRIPLGRGRNRARSRVRPGTCLLLEPLRPLAERCELFAEELARLLIRQPQVLRELFRRPEHVHFRLHHYGRI